jgi:RNA polymerase sigma-70 factor (ECF subfamily)
MERNENALLKGLRNGDEEAAKAFFGRYADKVYRMMYFSTSSVTDAEELTRETFLAFYQSLERFKGKCKNSTWLYSIAKNVLKSYYSKKRRRPTVSFDDDTREELQHYLLGIPSDVAPPDELVSRKETAEVIRAVLDRLPESYRTVLIHRYLNGDSSRETAKSMEKTEGNVRVLLHRASKAFARELAKLEELAGERLVQRAAS